MMSRRDRRKEKRSTLRKVKGIMRVLDKVKEILSRLFTTDGRAKPWIKPMAWNHTDKTTRGAVTDEIVKRAIQTIKDHIGRMDQITEIVTAGEIVKISFRGYVAEYNDGTGLFNVVRKDQYFGDKN